MHDKIKSLIDQKISNSPRVKIERLTAGYEDTERDASLISEHVTTQLQKHMQSMYTEKDAAEASAYTRETEKNYGGLKTQLQVEKHFEQEAFLNMGRPSLAFDIMVQSGSRIFGMPYDVDWSEGNGVGAFARFDGKAYTIPKANGFFRRWHRVSFNYQ